MVRHLGRGLVVLAAALLWSSSLFAADQKKTNDEANAFKLADVTDTSTADSEVGDGIHMTGALPMTAADEAEMRRHARVVRKVRLNKIGLARINEERAKKNLKPLVAGRDVDVAPVGEDVELSAPGAGATATTGTGEAAPAAGEPALPTSVNNSTLMYFPPIGNQGSVNSCAQWAGVYYNMTHEMALARDWNAKSGGDSYRFAPMFTYNFLNGGGNNGTHSYSAWNIAAKHGVLRKSQFNTSSYTAWSTNSAYYRSALADRVAGYSTISSVNTSAGLNTLKAHLANGHVAVYYTYINSWQYKTTSNDPSTTADDAYVGKSIAYNVSGTNGYHAMTVVGYNDDIWCDLDGDGVVDSNEKGAVRIANSWGTGWKESGYCWVAYQGLVNGVFNPTYVWVLNTLPEVHAPKVVAKATINHNLRNQVFVQVGTGSVSSTSPSSTVPPQILTYQGGGLAFSGAAAASQDFTYYLDFTDIAPSLGTAKRWFVQASDSGTNNGDLTIKNFELYYTGGGTDQLVGVAANTPKVANGNTQYVWIDWTMGDVAPMVQWTTASQASTNESGTLTVTAQLSSASSKTVTVPFTVTGTATSGADYTITASPITIAAGATTGTATITIKTDTIHELNGETVILTMGTPTNALLGATTVHTATITDDDNAAPLVNAGADQTVLMTTVLMPAFVQDSGAQGLVSMEAEHYHEKADATNKAWTKITDSGASGGFAMDSAPDDNVAADKPVVTGFRINFVKTGTHYIWVRGKAWPRTGTNGNADSVNGGLDGALVSTAEAISSFSSSYGWSKSLMAGGSASINVTTPGVHTVEIFVREDGFVCDKILLTTDSGYAPSGTGPVESAVSEVMVSGATATLEGTASDPDSDPLSTTWTVVSQPAGSTVAFDNAASVNTTATLTDLGTYTLRLTATDGVAQTSDDVVITVVDGSANTAPIAFDDAVTTDQGVPVGITLNALDAEGDALTYIVSDPTHGTLAFGAVPDLLYTPDAGFSGTDSFTFKVNDGTVDSNTATVTITVNHVNTPPTIESGPWVDTNPVILPNTTTAHVLASDADGDALTYTWSKVSGPGTVTFTPNGTSLSDVSVVSFGAAGTYVLQVSVSDGMDSTTGTVTVVVTATSGPPVAGYSRWFDASQITGVANGAAVSTWQDLSGNNAHATVPSGNAAPVYVANAGTGTGLGALYFAGNSGANNSAALRFASDGNIRTVFSVFKGSSFLLTAASTYHFHRPGNTNAADPLWNATYVSANIKNGKTYVNGTLINGTTAPMPTGLHNGFNLVEVTTTGAVTADSFNKDRTYHAGNQYQAEVIIYDRVLTDAERLSVENYLNAKWFSAASNTAPVASGQAVITDEDVAVAITLTATDADGDALTYAVVSGPAHGTLSGTAPNLSYTPNAGFFGTDSFTFKANDGQADSNVAAVSVTVNEVVPPNTAPVANNGTVTTDEDVAVAVTLTATDADGDALTYAVVSGPAHGTLSGAAPNLTYTPNGGFFGTDSFTFKANDGQADSNVATVSITVNAVNAAPVITVAASASPATIASDETTDLTVSASDPDGDALSYSWSRVSGPGTVTFGSGSAASTTASFSAAGNYALRVTVSDGALSTSSDVSVTVTEPVTATIHVASITCTTSPGAAGAKFGSVTVVIQDNQGLPVAGATVSGTFSGDFADVVSGVTDASGAVSFTTSSSSKKPSYTFTVTGVSHPDKTYDASANVETSDSY